MNCRTDFALDFSVFSILLLSLAPFSFAGQTSVGLWGPDIPAPHGAPMRDAMGNYHTLFTSGTVENEQIYYTRGTHLLYDWGEAHVVADNWSDKMGVRFFIGAEGRFHCAFSDYWPGNFEVFHTFSDDRGTSWAPPVRLTDAASASWNTTVHTLGTTICLLWDDDREGTPMWTYEPAVFSRTSGDNGLTWLPEVRVSETATNFAWGPTTVLDRCGTVHCVWDDSRAGSNEIFYSFSKDMGLTWSPNTIVTPDNDMVSELDILRIGPQGRLHLFWVDHEIPNRAGVYHCHSLTSDTCDGVTTWSLPVRLSDFDPIAGEVSADAGYNTVIGYPTVIVRQGVMHLLWANYRAHEDPGVPNPNISWIYWMYSRDAGETWSERDCISNVNSNSAGLYTQLYADVLALGWRDDRLGYATSFVKFLSKRKAWPCAGGPLNNTRYFDAPSVGEYDDPFVLRYAIPGARAALTEDLGFKNHIDLVVVGEDDLSLYDERGNLTWTVDPTADAATTLGETTLVDALDIADCDGDARRDIIVSLEADDDAGASGLAIYSWDRRLIGLIPTSGTGRLRPRNSCDFDDDTRAEILCSVEHDDGVSTPGLAIYNGDDGSLYGYIPSGDSLVPVAVSDVDNDGNLEILCSNPVSNSWGTTVGGMIDSRAYALCIDDDLSFRWGADLGESGGIALVDRAAETPVEKVLLSVCEAGTTQSPPLLVVCSGTTGGLETTSSLVLNDAGFVAAADMDGDFETEIVLQTADREVGLYSFDLRKERDCSVRLDVQCLADINGDGEIEVIGARGTHIVVLSHQMVRLWQVDAGAEILEIFVSDFGSDNMNELVVRTEDDLQVWGPPLPDAPLTGPVWVVY